MAPRGYVLLISVSYETGVLLQIIKYEIFTEVCEQGTNLHHVIISMLTCGTCNVMIFVFVHIQLYTVKNEHTY